MGSLPGQAFGDPALIPKILHYCWFGGGNPPEPFERCLASWRRYLPDFEIRRWDEQNSPLHHPFAAAQTARGAWAFLSDFVRFHALAEWGGLYADTDMEILTRPEDWFSLQAFAGFQCDQKRISKNAAAAGLLGGQPQHPFFRDVLADFTRDPRRVLITTRVTAWLRQHGLNRCRQGWQGRTSVEIGGVTVYRMPVMYPDKQPDGSFAAGPETKAIHHGTGNWGAIDKPDADPWAYRIRDMRPDRWVLRPLENLFRRWRRNLR